MRLLCVRLLLLLLLRLCLISHYTGTNAAALSESSKKARTVKREQLGSVLRNILNKHESNARLQNLQAALSNVRPAASISCNDNDIGIEFDLNDEILLPKDIPLQHLYTALPQRDDQLVVNADDVYCDEMKSSKNASKLKWHSAPNALTHFEYEQIAAPAPPSRVSVHQYGTNYFQHNSYAMPSQMNGNGVNSELNETTTQLSHKIQGNDKHTSTEEETAAEEEAEDEQKETESVESELSTPTTVLTTSSSVEMEGITKVMTTAAKPSSKDLSVENIFIINRNRKKKDRVQTTNPNTKGYKATINIKMSGNGKLTNVTSMQPKRTQNKQNVTRRRKEKMPAQSLSSTDIHVNGAFDNEGKMKANNNSAQSKASSEFHLPTTTNETHSRTIKPSDIHNAVTNSMEATQDESENRTERLSQRNDVSDWSKTDSSTIESVENEVQMKSTTTKEAENALPRKPTIIPASTSNDGKPAETNYYYYYTKPELKRNRLLKRLQKPTAAPQFEPIAYEALDSEFITRHDLPPKRNYIVEHHRKINDLKYSSSIVKRGGKLERRQSHEDAENCHQQDDGVYIPVKQTKNIMDIIATETKSRRENDTHYFRELRPFEEPIGGHECPEDKVGAKFTDQFTDLNRKRKAQASESETSESTNENQLDYFMCAEEANTSIKPTTKK